MSEVLAGIEAVLPAPSLKEHYKECVKKFLKTVVVIDDRAYQRSLPIVAVDVDAPVNPLDLLLVEPESVSDSSISQVVEPGAVEANDEGFGLPLEDKAHELDGPGLVRLFAHHGIICSIIQPEAGAELDPLVEEIKSIAQAADVLVLDWELRPGDHTASLRAIHEIVSQDTSSGGRLRFIVVYTASNQRVVKREIKRIFGGSVVTDGKLMKVGHACIVVLNKPSALNPQGVSLNDLPDTIFDLHSDLSSGMLPAAALSAIGTIRNHTHQILGQYKSHLDAAFITHRALIPKPDDAEAHFIELIADSLHHLMLAEGVRDKLSGEICIERLRELKIAGVSDEATTVIESCLSAFNLDKLSLISNALAIPVGDRHRQKRILEKFYPTVATADSARKEMAFLHDFTRSHLHKLSLGYPPRLTLGTVIAKPVELSFEYYLCIQPRCDSVRFENIRTFPLMKLANGSDSPNIHLEWGGAHRSLSVSEKLYDMLMFEFGESGSSSSAVVAEQELATGKWFFSDRLGQKFYWVGDLRREKAQRVVSKIASRLHLPGINEYEPTRIE